MNVGLYMDGYKPYLEFKDPGQITIGLNEIGIPTFLITIEKEELKNYIPPFPLIKIPKKMLASNFEDFFKEMDIVIFYSWITKQYLEDIKRLRKINKKIIIKSDSDGRIGIVRAPKPHFWGIRTSLWKIPLKIIPFNLVGIAQEMHKLEQIENSQALIIETPDAAQNLIFFLTQYKRVDLISKIHIIPNPVTPDFLEAPVGPKENIVISIGRWTDPAKNAQTLISSIEGFLSVKKDWISLIIGPGEKKLMKLIRPISDKSISRRIEITGEIDHKAINNYLTKAKILFSSSRWESFGIASSEAICMGCTLVGTPLESFRFLTLQGFSGNVASSFQTSSLMGTLIFEARRWEEGKNDPMEISRFWRKELNRISIGEKYKKIISIL